MSDAPWHCVVQQNMLEEYLVAAVCSTGHISVNCSMWFLPWSLLFKRKLWGCGLVDTLLVEQSSKQLFQESKGQKELQEHIDAPCIWFWSLFPLLHTQNPVLALAHWAAAVYLLLQVQFLILPFLSQPMFTYMSFLGNFHLAISLLILQ